MSASATECPYSSMRTGPFEQEIIFEQLGQDLEVEQ